MINNQKFENHWELFQDYCMYCGKEVDHAFNLSFQILCHCNIFEKVHRVRRGTHQSCRDKIREIHKDTGISFQDLYSFLEKRNNMPTEVIINNKPDN